MCYLHIHYTGESRIGALVRSGPMRGTSPGHRSSKPRHTRIPNTAVRARKRYPHDIPRVIPLPALPARGVPRFLPRPSRPAPCRAVCLGVFSVCVLPLSLSLPLPLSLCALCSGVSLCSLLSARERLRVPLQWCPPPAVAAVGGVCICVLLCLSRLSGVSLV